MIYTINGVTAHTEAIRATVGDETSIIGYVVFVNGERIGNRIDRVVRADGDAYFVSIARNERQINTCALLADAVADVLNDGMRDRQRR